jgi:hypothetical protein
MISSSFIDCESLNAAAKLVLPAGPLSIPSKSAKACVMKKTLP